MKWPQCKCHWGRTKFKVLKSILYFTSSYTFHQVGSAVVIFLMIPIVVIGILRWNKLETNVICFLNLYQTFYSISLGGAIVAAVTDLGFNMREVSLSLAEFWSVVGPVARSGP